MADPKVKAVISAKNEATSALASFKGSLIGIVAVVGTAVVAFKALKAATDKVIEAASRQESTEIALGAALASVKDNTREARLELNNYLSTLEDVTTIGSDEIAKIAVQLIQLGGLTGKELNSAIEITLGLQAVTGRAANSIAINIAKAARGMVAGLSQYGVVVDKTLSSQEQFNDAMIQLNGIIGIGGKVLGLGFAGALRRIDNDLDNLNKAIGKSIVESDAFNEVLDFLSGAIKELTRIIQENPEVLQSFILVTVQATASLAGLAAQIARVSKLLPGIVAAAQGPQATLELLVRRFTGSKSALEEFVDTSEEGFLRIAEALEGLALKLDEMGAKTTEAAGEIPNIIIETTAATLSLTEALDKAVSDLSLQSFEELQEKARAVENAFNLLTVAALDPDFSQAKFDVLSEQLLELALALQEAGAQFTFLNDFIEESTEKVKEQTEAVLSAQGFIEALSLDVVDLLEGQARAGALSFGDALVDAATGGEKAFKRFFEALLRDIASAIVQALVLKAITSAIGFFGGGGIGPGGIPLVGSTVGLQRGGRVRGESIGRDSVRALLKPGEVVLPESLAGDFSSIAAFASELRSGRGAPAGGGSLGNVTIPLTVVGGDDDSRLANLIERLNDAVTRSGFTLIASETTV